MDRFISTICAVILLAVIAVPAAAQGLSANIAVTNDYIWRGVTQSDSNPAVQGGLDYDFGEGFAVGVWGSTVDFNDGETDAEIDVYAGVSSPITEMLTANAGVIGYIYPYAPSGSSYNFAEIYGGLDWGLDMFTLSGTVYYSPDISDSHTFYYLAGLSMPVGEQLEFFANLGYYTWGDERFEPTDYNVGVAFTFANATLAGMFVSSDLPGAGDKGVVSLTLTIP